MLNAQLFGPDAPPPNSVLVTGGAGFVGHAIVRTLRELRISVRVLDPGPSHPDWPEGVEHIRRSVLDATAVEKAARGTSLVIHTAGLWDGSPGGRDRMWRLNVDGTQNVLSLRLPLVYTSSSITCGFGSLGRPGTEDESSEDPRHPLEGTPLFYRETKLAAEDLVKQAGAWIVNPDYVVGPGDVNGVVTQPLLRAAGLPLVPAPKGGKCFVAVDDVARGHLMAFRFGSVGRRYLLGAENRSYADIISTLARLNGRKPKVFPLPRTIASLIVPLPFVGPTGGALQQMGLARYRSNQRARDELQWEPGDVDEALLAMSNWSKTRKRDA